MRGLRLKFMLGIYSWSSNVYANVFKSHKSPWGITKEQFIAFPEDSLGHALGEFYYTNEFDIMPRLENHDVFHVVTETGTDIHDEIAMQYLLLGNGKLSLYLLGMIFIGGFVFPEYIGYYIRSYHKGKKMHRFYDVEFKDLLHYNLAQVQNFYKSTTITYSIK